MTTRPSGQEKTLPLTLLDEVGRAEAVPRMCNSIISSPHPRGIGVGGNHRRMTTSPTERTHRQGTAM